VFEGQGVVREYVGGYADWLRQRPQPAAAVKVEKAEKPKPATEKKPTPKKLSYKLQRELDLLPQQLEEAEAELERLHQLISAPEFYSGDQADVAATLERLHQQEQYLETLMERWVELESMQS
jgi:ATP-binding cassette subfamily F protein uup